MEFLYYTGIHDKIEEFKYKFEFKANKIGIDTTCFIPSPVYDVPFKKMFFYNKDGKEIAQDFLNSILYPESNSIEKLDFLPKEILSNSHIISNKGTRIVDNAYLAKIKEYDSSTKKEYYKEVIIDIEMEKKKITDSMTEKFFNYGTGLRNRNDFKETWVIALFLDKTRNPGYDKGSNSYVIKVQNYDKTLLKKNYIKIYEIYLNNLFSQLFPKSAIIDETIKFAPKSAINGETINIYGMEWVKLLCLSLWCQPYAKNDIFFCLPNNIKFKGTKIINAFDCLKDISEYERSMILIEVLSEKNDYEEGYTEGEKIGYENGISQGYKICLIKFLDTFYENFKANKPIENIEILGKIPYNFLIQRYGQTNDLMNFANLLNEKGLLELQK